LEKGESEMATGDRLKDVTFSIERGDLIHVVHLHSGGVENATYAVMSLYPEEGEVHIHVYTLLNLIRTAQLLNDGYLMVGADQEHGITLYRKGGFLIDDTLIWSPVNWIRRDEAMLETIKNM
jgi:hypothetical protein